MPMLAYPAGLGLHFGLAHLLLENVISTIISCAGSYTYVPDTWLRSEGTVNPEIFARIFSLMALKDIFATFKICD